MEEQYKLVISINKRLYKEFIITGKTTEVMLGTTSKCGFRLSPEHFFSDIEILLYYHSQEKKWKAMCNDSVYLGKGNSGKKSVLDLAYGDAISVKYNDNSGNEAFEIRFMIDFDYYIPYFNWYIQLDNSKEVIIGDDDTCNIRILNQFAGNTLVKISQNGNHFQITEKYSKYGVFINGKMIKDAYCLEDYDFFSVAGITFYYKDKKLYFDNTGLNVSKYAVMTVNEKNSFDYPKFIRSTRRKQKIDDEKIQILEPGEKPEKPEMNIVTTLLPSLAMLALVVVLRGIMSQTGGTYIIFSVCSMGIGLLTTIISMIQNQKNYKKQLQQRRIVYEEYIKKKKEEIETARKNESKIMNDMFYDTTTGIKKVLNFDSDIFDRIPSDDDFLYVYLGKGKHKAYKVIDYKRQEKLQEGDDITVLPEKIANQYQYIDKMPVIIDLNHANAVGVVGTKKSGYIMFKNFITDIVVRQYHTEIKFYVLLSRDDVEKYEWLKLLPQITDENFIRRIVFDSHTKTNIFETLYKELTYRAENKGIYEHIVIFSMNSNGIASHPVSKFIEKASSLNATFVFFEEKVDYLPLYCTSIIECLENNEGSLYQCDNKEEYQKFTYNEIDDIKMKEVVKKVAAVYCEEISLESSLRKSISMFEMLGIYIPSDLDLKDRWSKSQIDITMAAPLGINAKEELVYLDLHERHHGPHGLVAGTTGSGKSEILQSFILSMATLYHPYEIGFVIIDFKGGGMANQFSKLPHLIGKITDIDGKEIDRSLKSIKAELEKRKLLFANVNVNNIDQYIKAYKSGKASIVLPHLIIIVDEFAELRAEQPDFMDELVSAARIGRSLGVHLILATQRPSGQVDDEIRSNSKFKLCLRVQNVSDSNDVINSPLAAEIKEPGRAYLQVGNNEVFELFQSAYSGGSSMREDESAKKKFKLYKMGMEGRKEVIFETRKSISKKDDVTELKAIVEYIHEYCEEHNIPKLTDICLPSLSNQIHYNDEIDIDDKRSCLNIPAGIYDDPCRQYQGIYWSEIGRENTLVIGGSQTGKTNFIQLCIRFLATNYSPEEVSLYIMDFGSKILKNLEGLNHIGGVVLDSETEKVKNLFKLLSYEINIRKTKFTDKGVSSYFAYKEAGYNDLSKIYIVIDNVNAFIEIYSEKYEEEFIKLCRDGISLGITVLLANVSTTGIGNKYMANISNRICFTCNESIDYCTLEKWGGDNKTVPKNVPGRFIFQMDNEIYEAQSFIAFDGEKEYERATAMRDFVEKINQKYDMCKPAEKIPEIPENLYWKEYERKYMNGIGNYMLPLGLDFETINSIGINLQEDLELAVIAKRKEKVAGFIKKLLSIVKNLSFRNKYKIYVIDSIERGLVEYKENPLIEYSIDYSRIDAYLEEVLDILNENRDEMIEKGTSVKLSYVIVVLNSKEVIEYISKTKNVMDKFRAIVEDYKSYGVLIVYGGIENINYSYNAPELIKRIKEQKRAVVLEPMNRLKVFDLSSGVSKRYNHELLDDEAYYVVGTDVTKIKIVN